MVGTNTVCVPPVSVSFGPFLYKRKGREKEKKQKKAALPEVSRTPLFQLSYCLFLLVLFFTKEKDNTSFLFGFALRLEDKQQQQRQVYGADDHHQQRLLGRQADED